MPRLVRQGRELLGLTQHQLAARAGVSRDRICRIETGHGGSKCRDLEAVLLALDHAGVVMLPTGRVDLANAPRWAIR
jgi:predicted transcriptional regulator